VRRLALLLVLPAATGCGGGGARPADVTTTTVTYAAPEPEGEAPATPATPAPAPVGAAVLTVRGSRDATRAAVWRVLGDGRASRVAFDFPAVGHESIHGTTAPVPSRDGRRVAFVRAGALAVLDVASLAARQVGAAAPPGQELLVSAWAPDGADVLVHQGDGYRLISTATGAASDVQVDGEAVGFFPDGTVASLSGDGRVLSRVVPGERTATTVVYRSATYMAQLALSPDGKSAACATRVNDADRVERIDLASAAVTTLADGSSGRAVQNPWPAFSPSGRLAWLEEPPLAKNEDAVRVAIEPGSAAVELGGAAIRRFHWIDDATLLLESEGRLVVVDVATGAIKGKTDVP
jgi:hypothetical protein